jgi:plasmid stability protein
MANINLRDLNEQVHREIKAIAALEGKSLQDLLVELIKEKTKKSKKKENVSI